MGPQQHVADAFQPETAWIDDTGENHHLYRQGRFDQNGKRGLDTLYAFGLIGGRRSTAFSD
jgi:hypothetical protein